MAFPLVFPIVFGGTSTPYDVAGDIINEAAIQVGLEPFEDPYAASDANAIQFRSQRKSLGRRLWREKNWSQLTQEYTFTTVFGTPTYALPSDFGRMVDQTGWNRTNTYPLGNVVTPSEWQYLKAKQTSIVFSVLFRPQRQQIYLYPDTNTPGGVVIAFEYLSRFWAMSAAASAPDKDAPTAPDDVIWFDPELMVCALKLAFLRAKGFDTTAAQDEYDSILQLVMGDDGPGAVLDLCGGMGDPLLSIYNLPSTGYGQ